MELNTYFVLCESFANILLNFFFRSLCFCIYGTYFGLTLIIFVHVSSIDLFMGQARWRRWFRPTKCKKKTQSADQCFVPNLV